MFKRSCAVGIALVAAPALGGCFSPSMDVEEEASLGSETLLPGTGSTGASTTVGYGSTATSQDTNSTGPLSETGESLGSGDTRNNSTGVEESEVSSGTTPSVDETSGEGGASGSETSQTLECLDASNPIALDGACVPCDQAPDPDAACAERSAEEPVCVGGSCHPCGPDAPGVCAGDTPACGPELNCVPCSYHSQCPDSACHIEEGRCFDEHAVIYVDAASSSCPGLGTEDRPFCDFLDAQTTVPEGGEGVIRLLSPAGVSDVLIEGARTIAIQAARENARFGTGDFESGNWIAIQVVDSKVFLDSIVVNSGGSGIGVQGEGACLYLDNVVVSGNYGGIGVMAGAEAFLRNTTVTSQPTSGESNGIVVSGARLEMVYSTVIATAGLPLFCYDASEVVIRNSILLTSEDVGDTIISCDSRASFSAFSTAEDVDGAGVVEVGFFEPDRWFQSPLVGLPALRLTSQGATIFRDLAAWEQGDPSGDADGHPRPSVHGTADYPGHDVPG